MRLILASSSPRRRQLLTEAGYSFTVVEPRPEIEAADQVGGLPRELVVRLARAKARDVALSTSRGLILGADTVAECGGLILGKPANRGQAEQMLRHLAGMTHSVHTGLCVWHRPTNRRRIGVATTILRMEPFSEQQLAAYLDSQLWQGKAGAFGYQDQLDWVHIVRGSPSNVVGLPMELLARMLKAMG